MTEQQLLKLKQDVDAAKTKVSELTGQRTALMKQLKDDWGCKTVEEAEAKLQGMESAVEQLGQQIDEGVTELKEKYGL